MEVKPNKIPLPFRKLTKPRIKKIIKAIKSGSTYKLACLTNGISDRIFYIWRNQGICDIEHNQETLCSFLVQSLSKVQQDEVVLCRQLILNNEKGHKGAEWTLEHAYQKYFSANAGIVELAADIDELKSQLAAPDQPDQSNEVTNERTHNEKTEQAS